MAKLWIDPPGGWKIGFPKVWDSDEHPDIRVWLVDNGYTGSINHVRCWNYEDEDADQEG